MTNMYELKAIHDTRQSFYGKAKVVVNGEDYKELYSHDTLVAEISEGVAIVHNVQSQTTVRHVKEFLKQHGFIADSKKQIVKDYMEVAQ